MTSEHEDRTNCVNCKAALDSPENLYCTSCGARQREIPERTSAAETTAHSAPASGSRAESQQHRRFNPWEEDSRSAAGEMLPSSCRRCNSEIAPNENYCRTCGLPVGVAGSGTDKVAGKPCVRVLAFALDLILVAIVSSIITILVSFIVSPAETWMFLRESANFTDLEELPIPSWVIAGIPVLLQIAYLGILNAKNRQTLFKKLFGIRTVDMQGKGLEYGKSFTRAFLTYMGILLISIGTYLGLLGSIVYVLGSLIFLVDAFSILRRDNRTLHDLLAGTRVVNTRA